MPQSSTRDMATGELAQVTGDTRGRRFQRGRVEAPEGGTLTVAPKNPNKTFRLFVFENMRSSPNDRFPISVPQARRAGRPVVEFGAPERLFSVNKSVWSRELATNPRERFRS
jgi:hypothetical protein